MNNNDEYATAAAAACRAAGLNVDDLRMGVVTDFVQVLPICMAAIPGVRGWIAVRRAREAGAEDALARVCTFVSRIPEAQEVAYAALAVLDMVKGEETP